MENKKVNRRDFCKLGAASGMAVLLGGGLFSAGCGLGRDSDHGPGASGQADENPDIASREFDVIIAGAGPGGCLAAYRLAQQGFSVGLFDTADEAAVGKPIVLAVEQEIFATVGLPYPAGDMLAYANICERIYSPHGKECIHIDCSQYPMPVAIHLDKLTRSIFARALASGVEFYGGYTALGPLCADCRVCGARFATAKGQADVKARLVIDATGFNAALARNLPADFDLRFPERSADIVSAANRFSTVDPEAARTAVTQGRHGAEEGWNRMGALGVYSTFFSCLSLKKGQAYVLTGCKRDYETADVSARATADGFMNEQGYFKERIAGIEGLIRISHSLDLPVADGFMAIGEAACQVVPIHASGVTSALYAAHYASGTAAAALRAGDTSIKALWPYAAQYQRTRGAILAGLDVPRQTVDRLTVDDIAVMLESGIMHQEDYIGGVLVREPNITAASLPARMAGFLKHPAYIPVLLKMGITAKQVVKHYQQYPEQYRRQDLEAWRQEKERLFDTIAE